AGNRRAPHGNAIRGRSRSGGARRMKRFAAMFEALDSSNGTRAKTAAVAAYFNEAAPRDAAWAAWFLTGNRPRQAVPTRRMVTWAAEMAKLPLWLFEESYDAVG